MKGHGKKSFIFTLCSLALLLMFISGTWSIASAESQIQRPENWWTIPTFSIVSVQPDQTVTIRTYNFPANDTFTVLMNYMHTQGIGGIEVTTIDSGAGGSFTATFNIPDALKGQQQIAIRLQSPTSGYYAYNWFWNASSGVPVSGTPENVPYFSITSVVPDQSVTITTTSLTANQTYNVLMNYIGTRGVGGINVGTLDSGSGGVAVKTYNIPDALKGQQRIAIRLENVASPYYGYNWFWNTTSGVPVSGETPPFFSVSSVVPDQTVTITTNSNLLPNMTYNVLMNYIGTRGVGGINVGTLESGAGGVIAKTYNIPDALKGQQRIAIRLESTTSPYYAYNWFWNTSGGIPESGTIPLPPGVIPTISISSVVRDGTVTVQTHNFPANDHFVVLMNYMHTQGIGGTQVAEFDSGNGGSFSQTFNIPDYLKGQPQIAIRVYSPTSGYYAYNWFWNNTAP